MKIGRSRNFLFAGLAFALLSPSVFSADNENQILLTNFWTAENREVQQQGQEALIESISGAAQFYNLLSAGPLYSADVPVGEIESFRLSADGTRFPYVVLIPETYDPSISYPVEYMLHGGVGRDEWEPGGGWWRRGYDSLKDPTKIIVVPASWREAFWWQVGQADSLPEILHSLKRTYNIDDNRVTMTGVSDGGTGTYFFAFKQPTEWAAFLPYIGHPGVLRNANSGGGYRLFFENLMNKPMYIVNGEKDPLYPVSSVMPFIEILEQVEVNHIFRAIEDGGHNTSWLPDELASIEQFKLDNPRDPFPDTINWVSDRVDRYNRNHWILIDELVPGLSPGILEVSREDNVFNVTTDAIASFTLLLNPEEVDFGAPIEVVVNGSQAFNGNVVQSADTLMKWASRDWDKSMLFTAELSVRVPGR